MTLPTCEKCDGPVTDDLKCDRCRREYTAHWLVLTQRGERDSYRGKR
jgi:hypothetical protein